MKYYFLLLILSVLMSCEKEEKPLPGVFIEDRVGFSDMVSENGKDYQKQLYFDLSTNKNVASNFKNEWDLAFSCDPMQPNIFVNSAVLMKVAKTGIFDFNSPLNSNDFKDDFEFERSRNYFLKGHIRDDFTETGNRGEVYIIDRGLDLNNQARGLKKIQILGFENGVYRLQIADLNSGNKQELHIQGDQDYNNVYLSFEDVNEVLNLEPNKEDWDLLFTKYMQRLFDGEDTVDYSVTGCIINPNSTKAYLYQDFTQDSTLSFYNLSAKEIELENFSLASDVIGHEWKYFDLNGSGRFLIEPRKFYFIQDNKGINYRLRFTGFYNQNGDKGSVTFEYLEL